MCSWKWEKLKIADEKFLILHKRKTCPLKHQHLKQMEMYFSFVFISSFVSFEVCIYVQAFITAVRNKNSNKKYLLQSKRRSKVHQKNIRVNTLQILTVKNIFQRLWVNKSFFQKPFLPDSCNTNNKTIFRH